jgi:hypothetical protein
MLHTIDVLNIAIDYGLGRHQLYTPIDQSVKYFMVGNLTTCRVQPDTHQCAVLLHGE